MILVFLVCFSYSHSKECHPLAYEMPPPKYFAESILKILLHPKIDRNKVCSVWPIEVESSNTFVVDITKLKHPDDVRIDFFGKWVHSGSHPVAFRANVNEDGIVEVEKCGPGATGNKVFYLRRLHGYHPSNSNFRRLIAFVSGMSASFSFESCEDHNRVKPICTGNYKIVSVKLIV